MGQYRSWLHHRAIDHKLSRQQTIYKQELLELDAHIAHIGQKTPMPTSNALLTMLMQQLKLQEHTTSQATGTQPAYNGAPQENSHSQNYQTPPPSNYGQQGSELQTADPRLAPQPQHVSPGLLTWGHLPNFAAQDIHVAEEEQSVNPIPILSAATEHLLPNDLNTLLEPKTIPNNLHTPLVPTPLPHERLPWWLRNLMQSSHEEQEPQQLVPSGQQHRSGTYPHLQTNQRVEHWFARRTRLIHYDK